MNRRWRVFLGTPEFAVPSLERMVAAGHEVTAVFTQPDRPKGRGQQIDSVAGEEAAVRLGFGVSAGTCAEAGGGGRDRGAGA